ncbi:thiamine phosphate synthase [Novosphingobium album (ex Hu et al. 2023)]|uniref:Thiamine phosphate synthase n=1 Tax=Novosphingobium album (ex Hu et al. 2023) TaxID=2930093 RepID=A0ABT0B0N1_9SPHN|nr:thiamine phosphate synthase [Novosphingobium album (ex Hu et al. 2023)]MCJ2178628.1 thiamine phosphate synthase [Novosphingobium album (ex Hu et al. 2023)]
MARCYSVPVPNRQPPLPPIWLVSDARNDAVLERALARLPRGSGLIYRHYHLPPEQRRARFRTLARAARRRGHCVVLSGSAWEAKGWGADGAYGAPSRLVYGPATLRLVTVHSLRELAKAHRARADAVLISPVFPTRSHPGAPVLGPLRFRLLAERARVPAIALGGMTAHRARAFSLRKWAAIQGLAETPTGLFPLHS